MFGPARLALGPAMLIRFANLQTAVIVLLSVIALFFFPAPQGSFVSTHGPMTTVRMRYEAAVSWIGMALSALRRIFSLTFTAIGAWLRPSFVVPLRQELPAFCVLRI